MPPGEQMPLGEQMPGNKSHLGNKCPGTYDTREIKVKVQKPRNKSLGNISLGNKRDGPIFVAFKPSNT